MTTWDRYCSDSDLVGPFENKILYAMCRDNPRHESPYVTAGKIMMIGRVYAAAPERGAGAAKVAGVSLAEAIAKELARSRLDEMLHSIPFDERFSPPLSGKVVELHEYLVNLIFEVTEEWRNPTDDGKKPRRQASFASKYLHFHRPNAFPIMDSFAKAGLNCAGIPGVLNDYKRFCSAFALHLRPMQTEQTLRQVDTELVTRGREHGANGDCRRCATNASLCAK